MVVLAYMFVLRVGVPLVIVVMWGAAIKKWLEQPEPDAQAADTAKSLPVNL
jgi:hypothetical protein